MAAAAALGWSTLTVTSPDSRTLTRVTEPRKVRSVTMPLPPAWTAMCRPSGRTSTSTSPGSPAAVSPCTGTTVPSALTVVLAVQLVPGRGS